MPTVGQAPHSQLECSLVGWPAPLGWWQLQLPIASGSVGSLWLAPTHCILAFPCPLLYPSPLHYLFTILSISLCQFHYPFLEWPSYSYSSYPSWSYLLSRFSFSKQSSSPWDLLFPAFRALAVYTWALVGSLELHAWQAALINDSWSCFVSQWRSWTVTHAFVSPTYSPLLSPEPGHTGGTREIPADGLIP